MHVFLVCRMSFVHQESSIILPLFKSSQVSFTFSFSAIVLSYSSYSDCRFYFTTEPRNTRSVNNSFLMQRIYQGRQC